MRKLLLLLVAAVTMIPAMAQQGGNSAVFNDVQTQKPMSERENLPRVKINRNALGGANKTTANSPFWYSYVDVLYQTGVSKGYYNVVYQDSNLTYVGTSGTSNVFWYGMGILFDPTDSTFYYNSSAGQIQDYDYVNQDWAVTQSNSYSIDSFQFNIKYYRTQNVTDSLIIYVAKVGSPLPTGYYAGQYTTPPTRKFLSAWYDSVNNNFQSQVDPTSYIRIAKAMDASFAADTTATGGYSNYTSNGIALPSPMVLAPGQKVLVYVHFKSGTNYPLNTPVTSANYIRMYSYDTPGQDVMLIQNKNSYMTSLFASRQIKYTSPNWSDFTGNGHSILIPGVAYTSGNMTDFAFKVTCATCPPLSIKDTPNPISDLKVFPNPATDQVSVSFNVKETMNINVTISNTVGQVLKSKNMGKVASGKAVFETSDLASGVYFYTVEANGHRSAGRFVVTK